MMRILHVISSVNPANGGPIEGIKQFARAHVRSGHQVEVCSLDDPSVDWVSTCELPVHAVGPAYTHYRYAPALLGWLRVNAEVILTLWGCGRKLGLVRQRSPDTCGAPLGCVSRATS